MLRKRAATLRRGFAQEDEIWGVMGFGYVAASTFSVNTNPRLKGILRFMLTLNAQAFDIGVVGVCQNGEGLRWNVSF